MSLLDRIVGKVEIKDCWEWTASRTSQGYGWIHNPGGSQKAHVAVWEALVGPKSEGLELDHLCRNRLCVNPDHLEEVTHAENMRRGESFHSMKTHCPQGHEYSGGNLYEYRGERHCRTCKVERTREWRARAALR